MNFRGVLVLFILSFPVLSVTAQKLKKADRIIMDHLSTHVNYLSSNKADEQTRAKLVSEYICSQFKKNGIEPRGDAGGYFQAYDIAEGMEVDPRSYLFINGEEIKRDGYFPLLFSPHISLEAAPAPALKESGEPWFLDLKEDLENHQSDSTFNVKTFIIKKAQEAADKGATTLFIYNTSSIKDGITFNGKEKAGPLPLPVVYISQPYAKKYLSDETAVLDIKLKVAFTEKKRTGKNIVGYINNNAPDTVVISTLENTTNTAALIEIGNLLKNMRTKNKNYVLIAFMDKDSASPAIKFDNKASYTIDLDDQADMEKLRYIYTIVEKAK